MSDTDEEIDYSNMFDPSEYGAIEPYIKRFKEHDDKAEHLYNKVEKVSDLLINKMVNSFTMNNGVKDFSSIISAMSALRSDGITATKHGFDAIMKFNDLKLKEKDHELRKQNLAQKSENDDAKISLLMRQMSSQIQGGTNSVAHSKDNRYKLTKSDNKNVQADADLLQKRIDEELQSGNISINKNENAMKYDFNGIEIKYNHDNNSMVIFDMNGTEITDYPDERIPLNKRVSRVENGVAYTEAGDIVESI